MPRSWPGGRSRRDLWTAIPRPGSARFDAAVDRHPMAEWLAGLDAEAVSGVLDRRPDVVLGRPPATLGELAQRLAHPASVLAALRSLPLPCLQVMEALQALGEPRSRARLVELLDGSAGAEHAQAVEDVLARLTAMALVWPGDGDRLEVPTGLAEVFPTPLGLGPPAREAWEAQNADAVKRALGALGG